MLFLAFAYTEGFRFLLYVLVLVIGILVGLEIPLLMRILKERFQFQELVANVLTFDYLGALGASLLFPLRAGAEARHGARRHPVRARQRRRRALVHVDLPRQSGPRPIATSACVVVVARARRAAWSSPTASPRRRTPASMPTKSIFARTTPYQRIVLTKLEGRLRLFLNSHLQFSSRDEYRYHEALVHPGLAAVAAPRRVLVLGGGDGLAVREILKYPGVESITLVDLDPEMTELFRDASRC